MTNLQHLYDAIEGRTKGPVVNDHGLVYFGPDKIVFESDGGLPNEEEDATFIATMGTCADEIAAVLRAAEDVIQSAVIGRVPSMKRLLQLEDALASLAAKSGQGGTK